MDDSKRPQVFAPSIRCSDTRDISTLIPHTCSTYLGIRLKSLPSILSARHRSDGTSPKAGYSYGKRSKRILLWGTVSQAEPLHRRTTVAPRGLILAYNLHQGRTNLSLGTYFKEPPGTRISVSPLPLPPGQEVRILSVRFSTHWNKFGNITTFSETIVFMRKLSCGTSHIVRRCNML